MHRKVHMSTCEALTSRCASFAACMSATLASRTPPMGVQCNCHCNQFQDHAYIHPALNSSQPNVPKSIHLREALISAGHFGDPAAPLAALLATAFNTFKLWRRCKKIPCSQKQFRPRHLVKDHHGFYFTAKAYNSRIILMWLAEACHEASMNDPGDLKLRLHASALTLALSIYHPMVEYIFKLS